ncbi:amino acid adenylation domain-containing protein [filamentous cyanobacterium LEGE 11480]|uniref:Amino acid adenylation domain-containing protein n=1 Tax=Romeriopsis navalis LEGE 11480 TaxID=2777977 RepID=A0A928VND3_9CYAN|nr:amino acid adenylation domain-containing protein [Romeriopsis navalis]MBE9029049.1 amino acid adenylation domain-containing protein [Romeriopsis navalis LEGE 11480]
MTHEKYMRMAIAAAKSGMEQGQVPIGTCIVKDGQVISCTHNHVVDQVDPTGHAEIYALREAGQQLNTIDLSGCTIYATLEPCSMCFAACDRAKVSKIFYGARIKDTPKFGFLEPKITAQATKEFLNSSIELQGDFLRDEVLSELQLFAQDQVTAVRPQVTVEQVIAATPSLTKTQSFKSDACLHQVFESQVQKYPTAVAVSCNGETITYADLNNSANQLAHWLQDLGVKPETKVALCVDRSINMIIGILGILKAGGAYVPLDPAYPQKRLTDMMQDTKAPVLVTQSCLQAKFSRGSYQVVLLDGDAAKIQQCSSDNRNSPVSSENLAYVIYTSGSTGNPKGVMVNHSSVVRLFPAARTYVQFDQHDIWTSFHSCSFGFSVWEIFGALLHGGRLVIVPQLITGSAHEFYQLICQENITILSQTPSAFRLLLQAPEIFQTIPAALRLIVFSGESLEPYLLKSWFDRYGDELPQLVNMYALTETAGEVAYRRLTRQDLCLSTRSMIGHPLPDVDIYILDDELRPVAAETEGNLYIGGDAVARGYLNQPELTREKFIPAPLEAIAQSSESDRELPEMLQPRLYQTGDRVRCLPSGELEFLGRRDRQIKLRGYRLELTEIEACLFAHPDIAESLVILHEDAPSEHRLIAYIIPTNRTESLRSFEQSAQGFALKDDQLLLYLKEHLPEYMMPANFIRLYGLPLMPNGKIDRCALPIPGLVHRHRSTDVIAPRSPMEDQLSQIWCELLKIDLVSINDDFFELGGHSLLANQLLHRVQEQFQVELPLLKLFEAPTIAKLAVQITLQLSDHPENKVSDVKYEQMFKLLDELDDLSDTEVKDMI